jgi:hypothetical protein
VSAGSVDTKEQRFLHITFVFNDEEEHVDEYTCLLKTIKTIIHNANGQPETLWNDVSFYYSQKAYPLIHKIENLMRKLIAYFMLTTIGKEWIDIASPAAFKEAIDKSKRKQYLDALHQVDFKHLGDFLFKSYETRSVSELYEQIESAKTLEDLNLGDLKSFTIRSNWERYFSEIVECDNAYLDKRWNQLYELRCKVAHNAIVVKDDYTRIVELVDQVEEKLQKAIDNIDKIHVPQEDREQVAENAISNINALYGEFIQLWKNFQNQFNRKIENNLDIVNSPHTTSHRILQTLRTEKIVSEEWYNKIHLLQTFRNELVHKANVTFTEQEVYEQIIVLKETIKELEELFPVERKWKTEIEDALQKLGGQAHLSDIYTYVQNNTKRELPENWKAIIRYILQLHASDTKTSRRTSGESVFQHLDRGYWGLKNYNNETE